MMKKWKDLGIEALICPNYVHVAFKDQNAEIMGLLYDYTFIWNLVNYPAGCVPISEVLPEEEQGYEDEYNDIITKTIREDMIGSVGMPTCV